MGPLRVVGFALLALLLVAGCGSVAVTPPAPTPADFTGIATELTKRGLVLDKLVSGDAGCTDQTLIQTAIGFDAKGLDQADPVRLRIYIFRNRDAFDRLRSTVDTCARSYVTDPDSYEALAVRADGRRPVPAEVQGRLGAGGGGCRRHRGLTSGAPPSHARWDVRATVVRA